MRIGPSMRMFAMIGKIEKRKSFWKEKKYKIVEKGKNWTIERPGLEQKNVPDLNEMLKRALKKRKYKWE